MFYKLVNNSTRHFEYVAVTSITVDPAMMAKSAHGQVHVSLKLANNTIAHHAFERADWDKLTASFLQGGSVLNP